MLVMRPGLEVAVRLTIENFLYLKVYLHIVLAHWSAEYKSARGSDKVPGVLYGECHHELAS